MAFQPAGNFLRIAAQKYKLGDQVQASIVCNRVRTVFMDKYPNLKNLWNPLKYEDGVLTIQAEHAAASSQLFLHTHELIELFQEYEFPAPVEQIRIVRKKVGRE